MRSSVATQMCNFICFVLRILDGKDSSSGVTHSGMDAQRVEERASERELIKAVITCGASGQATMQK